MPAMRTRSALGVSVAGLLMLGATTGTTFALWHDSAQAAGVTATAGNISVTVNSSTAASFAGPTGLAPGIAKTVTTTVKNASVAAPNLRMQVYLDSVTSNQAAWTGDVEVAGDDVRHHLHRGDQRLRLGGSHGCERRRDVHQPVLGRLGQPVHQRAAEERGRPRGVRQDRHADAHLPRAAGAAVSRRLARALIVAAIALGTFLAPGVAAYALWNTTATATLTSVSTAPAPAVPGAPATRRAPARRPASSRGRHRPRAARRRATTCTATTATSWARRQRRPSP